MIGIGARKQRMPRSDEALPGRERARLPTQAHHVFGSSLLATDYPGMGRIWFGMGCFWGAERKFWGLPGVLSTAVGYMGGHTPNPGYREVCSGMTGHAEAVQVIHDPAQMTVDDLLKLFWEGHDPTQGMRQGNDVGTQYRSAIYAADLTQLAAAEASAQRYQVALKHAGLGDAITTEIGLAGPFYYAEDEHQQYLWKHPDGYCGLGGTGVSCPLGTSTDVT